MRIVGCIPSRYASTRLPGKPLLDIGGKPMVLHIVEKALRAHSLSDVVVLTDDERILKTVTGAGHRAMMTSTECASGTDRIAEFMHSDGHSDIFVNIQGDEILLNPQHIDQLVEEFTSSSDPQMGTLAHRVQDPDIIKDPTTAKIVANVDAEALYFSRSPVPVRQNGALPEHALIQIGIYIYTRDTLEKLTRLPRSPLEQTEHLEQLRALENNIRIRITTVDDFESLSVDTEQDLEKARRLVK